MLPLIFECSIGSALSLLAFASIVHDLLQVLGGEKNRSKWMAWMKASTFSKEEAMARYVSVALSVVKSRGEEKNGANVVAGTYVGAAVAVMV